MIRRHLLTGVSDAIWCSFVSMTTVGYGDTHPRTNLGRFAMTIWVMVGLIMVGVMCGTVFDAISRPPNVYGTRIAVIPNTTVEHFARNNLMAKAIVHGPTYHDIFGKVQRGEVDAALVNSDVYVAYQTWYRDPLRYAINLHVVQEFEMNQDVWIATKFNDVGDKDPSLSQQSSSRFSDASSPDSGSPRNRESSSKYKDASSDGHRNHENSSTPSLDGLKNSDSSSTAASRLYRCMTVDNYHLIFRIPVMQEPSQVRIDFIEVSGLFETVCIYLCTAILVVFSLCVACRMWEINRNQQQRIDNSNSMVFKKYNDNETVETVDNNISFSESVIN